MTYKIIDKEFKVSKESQIDDPFAGPDFSEEKKSHFFHLYNRFVTSRFRVTLASVQSRSEVSVTTKKAMKQKGTGNARRGTASSVLLKGGAPAGSCPKPRQFSFKLNKKFISAVKASVFSSLKDNLYVLDSTVRFDKTKEAVKFLSKAPINESSKCLFLCSLDDYELVRPFQNIDNVIVDDIFYFEPELLSSVDIVMVSESSFNILKEAM